MDTGRPRWRSRAWIAAAFMLAALLLVLSLVGIDGAAARVGALTAAALVTLAVIVVTQLRIRTQRHRYEHELTAWASRQAAQTERLRIAADLHDLVSHGLGTITLRAAAASSVQGPGSEHEQAAALLDIERVSRETTLELRRMLSVLNDPSVAPLRPADTLNELPAIVQNAHQAGLNVTLDAGELDGVSPGAQLTVCTVVREALQNTLRHAGPTDASVQICKEGSAVVVKVQDAGPRDSWQSVSGAGYGLDGLRERVNALGGSLHAGSATPGFCVIARVPDEDAL